MTAPAGTLTIRKRETINGSTGAKSGFGRSAGTGSSGVTARSGEGGALCTTRSSCDAASKARRGVPGPLLVAPTACEVTENTPTSRGRSFLPLRENPAAPSRSQDVWMRRRPSAPHLTTGTSRCKRQRHVFTVRLLARASACAHRQLFHCGRAAVPSGAVQWFTVPSGTPGDTRGNRGVWRHGVPRASRLLTGNSSGSGPGPRPDRHHLW